jgi:tripartite-type tricarboxylate transporter receptor subunit TctC
MSLLRLAGLTAVAAVATALAAAAPAAAQTFPNQPVRIVVPFGPGSASDMLARAMSEELSKTWGQQVLVENRPGLAGVTAVAKSPADGHTLMITAAGHTVSRLVNKDVQFDPVKDFVGITTVASIPLLVIANRDLSAKDLKEFIALAKANPGGYSFASLGLASTAFLANALFNHDAGIDIVHVPYKGSPDCVTAVIRGDAHIYFAPASIASELIQADRVRAYAVATPTRIPSMPQVPTLAEAGVPTFTYDSWFGILAPAGTPAEIVRKLNRDFVAMLNVPQMRERLARQGGVIVQTSTPEAFDEMIRKDTARFTDLFKKAGLGAK